MKNDALANKVAELVKPITDDLGYELYHVEFVREDGENYLRVYIDKEDGIALTDCENVSRKVSDMLDVEDPIDIGYYLEVSSPGIDRGLYKEEHFLKALGKTIVVKFQSAIENRKSIKGVLEALNKDTIVVNGEVSMEIPKDKIKSANLQGEI